MRRTVPLLVAAVAGLAPAATAAAATPLQLAGNADRPWVFVDRQGVTHVAWDVNEGLTTRTFYRRALPGSRSFSAPVELPVAPKEDFAGVYITQDPAPSNRLVMFTERCCQNPTFYALTSSDNGATWSAAQAISDPSPSLNPTTGRVSIVANAGATFYAINGNPSMRLLTIAGALAPGQPLLTNAEQTPLSPDPLDGQVALDAAGTPYFAHANFDGNSFVRVGTGGADVPVVTGSSIITTIKLAAGPRGVVALTIAGTAIRPRLETRVVTGGAVGAPVALTPADGSSVGVPFISADQTGRFHAVWREDGNRLLYRRSENGAAWSATQALFTTSTAIFDPVASAGPDGNGWVIWVDGTSRARVLALPLSATAPGDPAVPDTTGIQNPLVSRRGSTIVVSPRRPSLRTLRRTKCVNVRVQSTRPANIRVAIFSGRRSIRIFGATVVRFRAPGKKLVCIRVPLRARTFNVRQPFRFAFATRFLNTPPNRPVPVTTTPFTFFR
jgi:hypothetical protein